MPIKNVARILGLCALIVCSAPTHAQLLPAKADALYSAVLKEARPIEVYLPKESEKDSAARFETLYVLDGDWNAALVVNVVTFMRQVGVMPAVIVVSVPNVFDEHGVNSRDRDLTPTAVADRPRSGGAANFLAFLKTELVPYIDQRYPTNRVHLVHGHSFGGTFLLYTLMHEPQLFDGYAILDPALWWDNHTLDAVLDAGLVRVPAVGKAIYIGARGGDAFKYMGSATIEPIFEHKAPADLHWKLVQYAGESHDSLKLKGTYDALRFAYQGFTTDTFELVPANGIVVKGRPVLVKIDGDAEVFDMRYSTDGSVPTSASPKAADGMFAVSDPEKTKLKLLSNRGVFDRVIPINLKSGSVLPAPRAAGAKSAAWHVAFYPLQTWPELKRAAPFKAVDTDKSVDFSAVGRDAFAATVERNLDIPADGYYLIAAAASDKQRLYLAGRLLIEKDGTKGNPQQTYIVPLQRGVYPLRMEFQRAKQGSDAELAVFQCHDGKPECWKNELFKVSSRRPN